MKEMVDPLLVFTTCLDKIPPVHPGDVSQTKLLLEADMSCSAKELEQAADKVKAYFSGQFEFKDCKLNLLQYEEKATKERIKNDGRKIIVFRGYFEIGENPVFKYRGVRFGACTWEVKQDEQEEKWEVQRLQNL